MGDAAWIDFHGHRFALEAPACDLCGGSTFLPFWTKMRHGLDLPTVFCQTCGLCQTHPRPTQDALALFYSELYNAFHKRETPIDPEGEYVRRSAKNAKPRIELLTRFVSAEGKHRVIEIGAGVGQAQRIARERTSWEISGIEPGREQCELCRSQGLDVENVFFDDDCGLERNAYDAVISFHVFEHVESPWAFLARANALLKEEGLLHLEVPNLARPGVDLSTFLQFPHLYNFSAPTLRNYLQALGFRVIYLAERTQNLIMISKKVAPPPQSRPQGEELERYDVENFMQRLRMMERVFKLASVIPNVPILGKVKSTLMAI